jgi:hypothetical protein
MRLLEGKKEYHVGIELLGSEADTWGLDLTNANVVDEPEPEVVMV